MAPKGKSTTKKGKEVTCPEASQPGTEPSTTQPEEVLSFAKLRTCLGPAEAIHALFEYQRGIARHNEACTHGNEEATSAVTKSLKRLHIHDPTPDGHTHEEENECDHTKCELSFHLQHSPEGCQYGGPRRSQDRDGNVQFIDHIYRRLVIAPRQSFLTNAWVFTWNKELAQCDIFSGQCGRSGSAAR